MSFLCIFTRAFLACNVTKFYTRSFICICCAEFYFYWFYDARSAQRVYSQHICEIYTTHIRSGRYVSRIRSSKIERSAKMCWLRMSVPSRVCVSENGKYFLFRSRKRCFGLKKSCSSGLQPNDGEDEKNGKNTSKKKKND